jgi:hypothetical protein
MYIFSYFIARCKKTVKFSFYLDKVEQKAIALVQEGGYTMAYERKIDLMNESIFPRDSLYAQKKNPKESITKTVAPVSQTNQEIIDHVINEMSDTLGKTHDS